MTFLKRILPLLPDAVTGTAPRPTRAPYTDNERSVIRAYANGDLSYREQALIIFRGHLRAGVFRKDPYFEFMSEIDSPVPCWIVKGRARSAITGKPFP
jgi:hypothetical protein